MIDEQHIRQHLSRHFDKGETLKYLSIPKQYSNSHIILEVFKGALISAGIALIVFFSIWAKHYNLEAARDIACLLYLALTVALIAHSIFHYRKNLCMISAITDRALICLEYKSSVSDLNAVSLERTGEYKLRRIAFDSIKGISLLPNSDNTGNILYSLKGMEKHKELDNISVSNISLAREALPNTLITCDKLISKND